jgi:anti-sigma regulatory factor (Ser/Thr protein kinase)
MTAVSAPLSSAGSTATSGPITLTLPPIATMARVGRLTASSIASLSDMTIDDIDDIKIAVSEMITVLIQSGSRTTITLRFETSATEFAVEASTPTPANDLGRNDLALAIAVLDSVADEHHVASTDDRMMIRIVKRLAPIPAASPSRS